MKVAMFYHSLVSDWNHGNAHFLRGVAWELAARGHEVRVFEPAGGWSRTHLLRQEGWRRPIRQFRARYPGLQSASYRLQRLDLERALDGAHLVLAHEWNDPGLIRRLGDYRRGHRGCRLLFHDTHHRSVTAPGQIERFDLSGFDGVLAFGRAVAEIYRARSWAERVWVWHEAADTRIFRPMPADPPDGDLVWVGNWGDGERTERVREYLVGPASRLGLRTRIHGVRYPREARRELRRAGLEYRGWLPNFRVPEVFGRFRLTVHIPRGPYVSALPGIPTIRMFEALACGIPLVTAPWRDAEELFHPGRDFLVAWNGREMEEALDLLIRRPDEARAMAERGLRTVLEAHTCAHRVDELLAVCRELGLPAAALRGRAAGKKAGGRG